MNLPLEANKTYFSTIRGVTNEGNVLETSSDGFTVDQTPPVIGIDRFVTIIFLSMYKLNLKVERELTENCKSFRSQLLGGGGGYRKHKP